MTATATPAPATNPANIGDRIRAAILGHRRPRTEAPPPLAAALDEPRAAAVLESFAALMDRLHETREEMDRATEAVRQADGLDLAELVKAGQPLPRLGTMRADAENLQVECRALKSAADAAAADAGRAVDYLVRVSRDRLDIAEGRCLAAEPPAFLALPADLQRAAVRSLPWWGELLALREGLNAGHRPRLPVVRAEAGEGFPVRLADWRTEPRTAFERLQGALGPRDSWHPRQVADSCRRFLATVAEIKRRAEGEPAE